MPLADTPNISHHDAPRSFSSSLAYSAASSWATTNGFSGASEPSSLPLAWAEVRHASIRNDPAGDKRPERIPMQGRNDCTHVVLLTCLHLSHEMALRDVGLYAWTQPHVKDPQGSTMRIMRQQLQSLSPHHGLSIRMSPDPSKASIQHNVQKARLAAKPGEYIAIFYSGHGIQEPPTEAGELWCYDKSFEDCAGTGAGPTEYIPVMLFDMLTWAGASTCYVWDTQQAGRFIKAAYTEAAEIDSQLRAAAVKNPSVATTHPAVYIDRQIHFAACGANETVPRIHGLPDDLFTACLVTPLRVALLHHNLQTFPLTTTDDGKHGQRSNAYMTAFLQNMSPGLQDRLTAELRAITFTIAWQVLDGKSYQKLFGSSDVIAGLASGFLLAQRVLGSYRTTPESIPPIPIATSHPLWTTWDMILDNLFEQLPSYFEDERNIGAGWEKDLQLVAFVHDQLATMLETEQLLFTVDAEDGRKPPRGLSRLPIICQASLIPRYRDQACRILDVCLRGLDISGLTHAIQGGALDTALRLLTSANGDSLANVISIWSSLIRHPSCVELLLPAASGTWSRDVHHIRFFVDTLGALLEDPPRNPSAIRTACQAAAILAAIARKGQDFDAPVFPERLAEMCFKMLEAENDLLQQWGALLIGEVSQSIAPADHASESTDRKIKDRLIAMVHSRIVENRATAVHALTRCLKGSFCTTESLAPDLDLITRIVSRCDQEGAPSVRAQQLRLLSTGLDKGKDYIREVLRGDGVTGAESVARSMSSLTIREESRGTDSARADLRSLIDTLAILRHDPDKQIADRAKLRMESLLSENDSASSENNPKGRRPTAERSAEGTISAAAVGPDNQADLQVDEDDLLERSKAALDSYQLNDATNGQKLDTPGVPVLQHVNTPQLRYRALGDSHIVARQQVGLPWKWDMKTTMAAEDWTAVAFHSFLPTSVSCSKTKALSWSDPHKTGKIHVELSQSAFVTSARFVNELYERIIILAETNRGTVHILAADPDEPWNATQVSSFPALPFRSKFDLGVNDRHVVSSWWWETGRLNVGGASDVVNLWDCPSESCIRSLETDSSSALSCLITEPNSGNLLLGGFTNGDMRIWDPRCSMPKPILQWSTSPKNASVVSVGVAPQGYQNILAATSDGYLKTSDLRNPVSPRSEVRIHEGGITSASFQSHSGLISTVSAPLSFKDRQQVPWSIHRFDGTLLREVTVENVDLHATGSIPYTVMHTLRPFLAIGSRRVCHLRGSGVGSGCDADAGSYAFAHAQDTFKGEERIL